MTESKLKTLGAYELMKILHELHKLRVSEAPLDVLHGSNRTQFALPYNYTRSHHSKSRNQF